MLIFTMALQKKLGKVGKYSLFRALNQPFEAFCGEYSSCSRAAAIWFWVMYTVRCTYDRYEQTKSRKSSGNRGASLNFAIYGLHSYLNYREMEKCSYQGVEYTFIDPVPPDLVCSICHELLNDVQQTVCGHLFCKTCLQQAETAYSTHINGSDFITRRRRAWRVRLPCPTCKAQLGNPYDDRYNDRRVKNLELICTNDRCTWTGPICQLKTHKNTKCDYEETYCPENCGKIIMRFEIADHKQKTCPHRPFSCNFCKMKTIYKRITEHYQICQKLPVTCPYGCGTKGLVAKSLEGHLEECNLRVVECSYFHLGCKVLLRKEEMMSHEESAKDSHLDLAIKRIGEISECFSTSLQEINKAFTKIYRDSDSMNQRSSYQEIPYLSDPLSQFNYVWLKNDRVFPSSPWILQMDSYKEKKKADIHWFSPPVYSSLIGYKFCLLVYAGGYGQGKGKYLSVFPVLASGPYDEYLHWPLEETWK